MVSNKILAGDKVEIITGFGKGFKGNLTKITGNFGRITKGKTEMTVSLSNIIRRF